MTTEEWRPVGGYEGIYEVSNLGRVKSLARVVEGRPGVPLPKPERILKPFPTADGYAQVALCRQGVRAVARVHRLVLTAFVGPGADGTEGCHNDGDKNNNALVNLRWDTRSANTLDKVTHGAHPFASRTQCPQGHEYSADNTYRTPKGGRHCRTCKNANKRAARKAAA